MILRIQKLQSRTTTSKIEGGCVLRYPGGCLCGCFVTPLSSSLAAGGRHDVAGSKDPDLFSRMHGFHIYNYSLLDFDRYEFPVASGKTEPVEGRHYRADCNANDGIKLPETRWLLCPGFTESLSFLS
jgi:hypothetical protein